MKYVMQTALACAFLAFYLSNGMNAAEKWGATAAVLATYAFFSVMFSDIWGESAEDSLILLRRQGLRITRHDYEITELKNRLANFSQPKPKKENKK